MWQSNGKLLADIHGNLPKETWKRNFITALNGETVQDTHPPTSSSTNNSISEAQGRITPEYQRHEMHVPANSTVQDLLDERRLRLDVDQKEKKAAERAERLAKQETQRAAADNALPGSVRAKQASYAQQQKKKQQEMQQERERILKVIESDKLERKHKEEMRKTISQAGQLGDDGIERLIDRQLANEINQSESRVSKDCAIQVRLFDGSNIRSRFSPDQNIRTNIRTWIDKKRGDSDTPYTFKQILAPQPNRAISISEEEESLQELGLTPSATLVMVPVHGYTAAYSTDAGYISNGISLCYNTVFTGVVGIAGAFGTFLGVASEVAPSQNGRATQSPTQESPRGSSSGIKFRTLRDQQKSEDSQQFYNGNQVRLWILHVTLSLCDINIE